MVHATKPPRRAARGAAGARRRPPLTRQRVLDAALALVAREGLDALSMRRLAQELGVEAMSLYNHVASKDELLDGLVEAVVAQIEIPSPGLPWKEALRRRAASARQVFLRYPWAPSLSDTRRNAGPARLADCEAVFGVLMGAGFSERLSMSAQLALDSFVLGFTLQEASFPGPGQEQQQAIEHFRQHHDLSKFPLLLRVTEQAARASGLGRDEDFFFGLGLLLDGLEAALLREQPPRKTEPRRSPKRKPGRRA